MSFKNALVYSLTQPIDLLQFSYKLNQKAFVPCTPKSEVSVDWTKPAEFLVENDLVYRIGQYDLIALKTESKVLPSASINKILGEKITEIEEREARKLTLRDRSRVVPETIVHVFSRSVA